MQNRNSCGTQLINREFSFVDELELSSCAPPIKKVLDFAAKIFITESKILHTCTGYKLMIKGCKAINVRYMSNDCDGKVIYKKFVLPFFELVQIPPCSKVVNVTSKMNYYDIENCEENVFWFYNLVTLTIVLYIENSQPIIKCPPTDDKCCDDWHFINDQYPSTKDNCNNSCDKNAFINCDYYIPEKKGIATPIYNSKKRSSYTTNPHYK